MEKEERDILSKLEELREKKRRLEKLWGKHFCPICGARLRPLYFRPETKERSRSYIRTGLLFCPRCRKAF